MKKLWSAYLVIGVILLDQLTKYLVRLHFAYGESITLIPGLLDFTYVRNTGAAFGMFAKSHDLLRHLLLLSIPVLACLWLIYLIYQAHKHTASIYLRLGYPLILAGAVGNLIDRIWLGYVVDFVDFYFKSAHFPAFNVADSSISIAAALLLLDFITTNRKKRDSRAPDHR